MQIYREMTILSQTPPREDLKKIPYHLQQALSPTREFNAAQFSKKAVSLIRAIRRRGRLPLVAGGTGLYLMALLDGLFEGPAEHPDVRRELTEKARVKGSGAIYADLQKCDPEAAKKIHPNDVRRIVRALEVIWVTGEKFSKLKTQRRGIWGTMDIRIWGMLWDRETLNDRIDKRVRRMFRAGLTQEVSKLLQKRLSKTARGCLGLKELQQYFEGQMSLKESQERLLINTRRFAKRQMTWFKRDSRIRWISMQNGLTPAKAGQQLAREIKTWIHS